MLLLIGAAACSFFTLVNSVSAQGSLTPPGAPAPAMKSLDQIEPRTPVDAAHTPGDANNLFVITIPGSYYLTTNIVGVSGKSGIGIQANNVTLDLRGFSLLGVPASGSGINIPFNQTNITVRNGTLSGWASFGVTGNFPSAYNLVFENLTASANGAYGISISGSGAMFNCLAQSNGSGGLAIEGGVVSGCTASGNSTYGIFVVNTLVRNCQVSSTAGVGIFVETSTVADCFVQNSVKSGIYVNLPGCQIIGNTCIRNNTSASVGDAGIFINDSNNRVENNHVTASGHAGIQVNSPTYVNNVVIKNTVSGSGANNYLGTASNDFGPIGVAATATSPWANISQ